MSREILSTLKYPTLEEAKDALKELKDLHQTWELSDESFSLASHFLKGYIGMIGGGPNE